MNTYIGIDLHKQIIVVCAVGKDRRVLSTARFSCSDGPGIQAWFAKQVPFEAVVEATASYEWMLQLIEPLAERLTLAHPAKLRIIAESTRKSDKLDARVLAEFLALGMIPNAYRPTPRQREHRRLVRYRHYLQGHITSLKNRIRHIVADYNCDRRDLFTRVGRHSVAKMPLLEADRFVLEDMWLTLAHYQERIRAVDRTLRQFAGTASPSESRSRALLKTIPGVGPITIEIFLAESADIRRFGSQKKLASYAGLVPGYRESAGHRKELGITHQGSKLLRWVMTQAAWQLVRRDARWRRIFESLSHRRGKKKAIIAISRRLLGVMMSVVINDQPYRSAA